MRHLTRHRVFPDVLRLWQASASLALNRAGQKIQGGLRCPGGGPWRHGRFFVFRPGLSSVSSKHYSMAFLCYYTSLGSSSIDDLTLLHPRWLKQCYPFERYGSNGLINVSVTGEPSFFLLQLRNQSKKCSRTVSRFRHFIRSGLNLQHGLASFSERILLNGFKKFAQYLLAPKVLQQSMTTRHNSLRGIQSTPPSTPSPPTFCSDAP